MTTLPREIPLSRSTEQVGDAMSRREHTRTLRAVAWTTILLLFALFAALLLLSMPTQWTV